MTDLSHTHTHTPQETEPSGSDALLSRTDPGPRSAAVVQDPAVLHGIPHIKKPLMTGCTLVARH